MDATGLVVSPGMVDAHTDISEPGRTHWEGYETGTRAAAKGGITTMIEMPSTSCQQRWIVKPSN
jgi:allantoinase